ncbi:MAG: helix-turn-helix domain-containing protein [Kiritimatiellia bacterium]
MKALIDGAAALTAIARELVSAAGSLSLHTPATDADRPQQDLHAPVREVKRKGADMIDRREAAELLGVSVGTLANWACTGRHRLPHVKIGKHVRYRVADLERWIEARFVNPV